MTATKAVFGDLTQAMDWAVQSAAQTFYSNQQPLDELHNKLPEGNGAFVWYVLSCLTRDTLDNHPTLARLPGSAKDAIVIVLFLAFGLGYLWATTKGEQQDA